MSRDPRVDPVLGDAIDDDPPLDPLYVRGVANGKVYADRYAHTDAVPCSCAPGDPLCAAWCDCEGCRCTALCKPWTLEEWRAEMAGAVVIRASDGPLWAVHR